MKKKIFLFFTVIAVMMMCVGCTNNDNQSEDEKQAKANETTSGLEKNVTIVGKIQDMICDIVLDAKKGTFTASGSSRATGDTYSGEFFYFDGALQLKVTTKNDQKLPDLEIICLSVKVTLNNLKADINLTFESKTLTDYELGKINFVLSKSSSGKKNTEPVEFNPVYSEGQTAFNLAGQVFINENAKNLECTGLLLRDGSPVPSLWYILFCNETSGWFPWCGVFVPFTYKEIPETNQIICTMCSVDYGDGYGVRKVDGNLIINVSEKNNTLLLSGKMDMEMIPAPDSNSSSVVRTKKDFARSEQDPVILSVIWGCTKLERFPFKLDGRIYKSISVIYNDQDVSETNRMSCIFERRGIDSNPSWFVDYSYSLHISGDIGKIVRKKSDGFLGFSFLPNSVYLRDVTSDDCRFRGDLIFSLDGKTLTFDGDNDRTDDSRETLKCIMTLQE